MHRLLVAIFLAGLALGSAGVTAAQEVTRTEPVTFTPGTGNATIEGRITGDESVLYTVGAEAGQTLRVGLSATNLATYFNIYAPGSGPGDEALATGQLTPETNRFEGTLQTSGTYAISVFMMRSAARRDEGSDYTLDIAVEGLTGQVVEGDFADGLMGGPDFWQVTTTSGPLNIRSGPSAGADVLGKAANGEILRNTGGCRMAEGRRWCAVSTLQDTLAGWAAGDFLREGAP